MCITVWLAHADTSLLPDQDFLVSIGKAGAQSMGQSEGKHKAASTTLSPDSSHEAQWAGSGLLYAHSDPGILCS